MNCDTPTPTEATSAWPLICTICGEGLSREGGALVCPRRHSFDVAREGYVNLLGGRARAKTLGDSPEMLRARRAFLGRGHYAPLAVALAGHVGALLPAPGRAPAFVCDVGCGEGYFIAAVRDGVAASMPDAPVAYLGIDVAKEAARLAARRYGGIRFVVADTWRGVPLADASAAVLLNVFAPRNVPEFARVLAPDGAVIAVIPGAEHLAELRRQWGLLDVEEGKRSRLLAQMGEALCLSAEESLRYTVALGGDAAAEIVAMGPSARHLGADAIAAIAAAPPTPVSIAFDLLIFRRL
ncbi:MAG: putative RNA methyltransferase [Anaerolineae bacterium]